MMLKTVTTSILLLASTALAAPVAKRAGGSGTATYFGASALGLSSPTSSSLLTDTFTVYSSLSSPTAVGLGSCGWQSSPGDNVVAMNSAQANGGSLCGKHITVTNNTTGKSTDAVVVDEVSRALVLLFRELECGC